MEREFYAKFFVALRRRTSLIFLIAAVCASFGCSTKGEPATVADVCGKPHGTRVEVEGYLVLPNFMTTKTIYGSRTNKKIYQLFLTAQPDGKGVGVRSVVSGTDANEPNSIRNLPPTGYTFKDLKIFNNRGAEVSPATRLKTTATVRPGDDGRCDLEITKIETL
jgi:hypothetical protein